MTNRDCEHGQLARSCHICDLEREIALLQELTDAPEPEPVGEAVDFNGWRIVRWKGEESSFPLGTKFYTAPPAPSVPDGWREIIEAVLREMPARKGVNGNAPGHGHRIAGIWDDDNGPLSGKPCAWCMTWNKVKAMLAEQQQEQPADLVIDLKHASYDALTAAAMRSKWTPPEYVSNDWLADCINFLENGHPVPAELVRDAERYRWLRDKCQRHDGGLTIAKTTGWDLSPWSGDDPDREIDAAREREKKGGA